MQSSRIVASAPLMYWQRFDCGKEGGKIKLGGISLFLRAEGKYQGDFRERAGCAHASADFWQPCEERGKPRLLNIRQPNTRPRQQNTIPERTHFELRSVAFFSNALEPHQSHHEQRRRRRWAQSPSATDQFHLQAPTTTFNGPDMALRAVGDPN